MTFLEALKSGRPFKLPWWGDWIIRNNQTHVLMWEFTGESALFSEDDFLSEQWIIRRESLKEALTKYNENIRRIAWPENKLLVSNLQPEDVEAEDWVGQ